MSKEYKYSFRAKPGRDDVIINWIEKIQPSDKSYYIREALRDYLTEKSPQDSSSVDTSKSINFISRANKKVGKNSCEEVDAEVSNSTLEANLNSWID
jgi:metal-responsive CopG/Arc/MetJ family transcriptional regulator